MNNSDNSQDMNKPKTYPHEDIAPAITKPSCPIVVRAIMVLHLLLQLLRHSMQQEGTRKSPKVAQPSATNYQNQMLRRSLNPKPSLMICEPHYPMNQCESTDYLLGFNVKTPENHAYMSLSFLSFSLILHHHCHV